MTIHILDKGTVVHFPQCPFCKKVGKAPRECGPPIMILDEFCSLECQRAHDGALLLQEKIFEGGGTIVAWLKDNDR